MTCRNEQDPWPRETADRFFALISGHAATLASVTSSACVYALQVQGERLHVVSQLDALTLPLATQAGCDIARLDGDPSKEELLIVERSAPNVLESNYRVLYVNAQVLVLAIPKLDGNRSPVCNASSRCHELRRGPDWATTVDKVLLRFAVSADEEHVGLTAVVGGHAVPLATRAHHYLLLTLARQRQRDRRDMTRGDGWIHRDELAKMLRRDLVGINVAVFRIRRQFQALPGVSNPADIIERRSDSNELRIGSPEVVIETC